MKRKFDTMDYIVGHSTENYEEERWSQLPTLLIWMIKDRLNTFDSFRVGCVCKNWESASASYTSKARQTIPWLMQPHRDSTQTSNWEFVNLFTKDKFVLDIPEFHVRTRILFSRGGWFLFLDNLCHLLVFFNIHTHAKIKMPKPENLGLIYRASFSSSDDGSPHYVVLDETSTKSKTLYIAAVDGSSQWTKQSYEDGSTMEVTINLVILRQKIYCLGLQGGLFIFDMANRSWKTVEVSVECNFKYHFYRGIAESEGDIVMVEKDSDFVKFSFFKLNHIQNGWDRVNPNEGRSWFSCLGLQHYSVKETGEMKKFYENQVSSKPKIQINDLIRNKIEYYNVHIKAMFVDLGWMIKPPPYCVRYDPNRAGPIA